MRLREEEEEEDEDEDEEDVVALVLPLPLFARPNALAPLASRDDISFFQRKVVSGLRVLIWWTFEDANRRSFFLLSLDDERVERDAATIGSSRCTRMIINESGAAAIIAL
jgi:hypothetical protein